MTRNLSVWHTSAMVWAIYISFTLMLDKAWEIGEEKHDFLSTRKIWNILKNAACYLQCTRLNQQYPFSSSRIANDMFD